MSAVWRFRRPAVARIRTAPWHDVTEFLPRPRFGAIGWLEEAFETCGAFEWITFAYLGWLIAVISVFHHNVAHAPLCLAIHAGFAGGILWLARTASLSKDGWLRAARHWYPLPLYLFFFEELGGLVHAISPRWMDQWLINFDAWLAGGVQPAMRLARFASPALNDFMQFAYMTYFLFLFVLPLILYLRGEHRAFWTAMVATALAHYSVYVIAVLLPTESPYHAFACLRAQPLEGSYCTAVIEFIERFGRVHGAAFPSAHVAGAMVAMLTSYRYHRWLFWVCLPFFVSMCVATVYGRYHYIGDVFAGLAVGYIGFSTGTHLMKRAGALPAIARDARQAY